MSIENPQTFGEYWYSSALEQQKAFDESIEKLFSPLISGGLAEIPYISDLPIGAQNLINSLITPSSPGAGGFVSGFAIAQGKDFFDVAAAPAMTAWSRIVNKHAKEKWLTSLEANTLYQRKKIPIEFWKEILSSEGYQDVLQDFSYKSQLPYPSITDLITYCRYTGEPTNVFSSLQEIYNVDPVDLKIWEFLGLQKLTAEQVLSLYKRGKITQYDADTELARIGWHTIDRANVFDLTYSLPNAMITVQGDLMQGISNDAIIQDISKCDIHPEYAAKYLDAILTKPASTDVIAYELRKDPNLTNLDTELRKIGIHPDYNDLYKELAYPIPPIADIITMAVREAFSPDIAARFGQYEDFPSDFAKYAGMKGLSDDWAKRYWAAHWSLPSPQQGFEMFQRGIITIDELKMLLRALDVMPFWRDKLIQIAYNPLTRVDVRRMYNLDVLTVEEVTQCYREIGYNDVNANRLTTFTVKLREQAKLRAEELKEKAKEKKALEWTATQTISFMKKKLISADRAYQELIKIGYDNEHASVYLASVS